jgi:hypothetical protein
MGAGHNDSQCPYEAETNHQFWMYSGSNLMLCSTNRAIDDPSHGKRPDAPFGSPSKEAKMTNPFHSELTGAQ